VSLKINFGNFITRFRVQCKLCSAFQRFKRPASFPRHREQINTSAVVQLSKLSATRYEQIKIASSTRSLLYFSMRGVADSLTM